MVPRVGDGGYSDEQFFKVSLGKGVMVYLKWLIFFWIKSRKNLRDFFLGGDFSPPVEYFKNIKKRLFLLSPNFLTFSFYLFPIISENVMLLLVVEVDILALC